VQKHVARGRVEVSVSLQLRQVSAPHVELNEEFAQALAAAIDTARSRGVVTGPLSAGDLLRLPQALPIRERGPDAGGVSAMLAPAAAARGYGARPYPVSRRQRGRAAGSLQRAALERAAAAAAGVPGRRPRATGNPARHRHELGHAPRQPKPHGQPQATYPDTD